MNKRVTISGRRFPNSQRVTSLTVLRFKTRTTATSATTAINPSGKWDGGVDGAWGRVEGAGEEAWVWRLASCTKPGATDRTCNFTGMAIALSGGNAFYKWGRVGRSSRTVSPHRQHRCHRRSTPRTPLCGSFLARGAFPSRQGGRHAVFRPPVAVLGQAAIICLWLQSGKHITVADDCGCQATHATSLSKSPDCRSRCRPTITRPWVDSITPFLPMTANDDRSKRL